MLAPLWCTIRWTIDAWGEMIKKLLLGLVALALVACGQNEGGKAVGPQFDAKAPLAANSCVKLFRKLRFSFTS